MTASTALSLTVIVPLVLSPLAWLLGTRYRAAGRVIGLAGALLHSSAVAYLGAVGLPNGPVTPFASARGAWLALICDGLSFPLLALTSMIGLLAVSASWKVEKRPGAHFGLLLFLQAAVSLVFLADNLLVFYIAWESVLLPMFILIGGWGSSNARAAATKFLVYTFAGGAVLLAGVILAIVSTGQLSIAAITQAGGVAGPQALIFWLLAFGMLVKLPAVGVHTWLPDAHTEAPTAGSIILAGVLLKMGGYGLVRIALPFGPQTLDAAGPVFVALGLIAIVWGAACAVVQTDVKRLVAYSSVAHMGFVAAAVGLHTPESIGAAVMTMVSHGLIAGLLFYLVGALYERTHTRDIAKLGGLGVTVPRWSAIFVFASLASAGLPGLSGFPGEFMTVLECFRIYGWWTLVIGAGVGMAAAYNLRMVRATVQGPPAEQSNLADLDVRESVSAVLMAAAIIVLGVAPWLVTAGLASVVESLPLITAGVG